MKQENASDGPLGPPPPGWFMLIAERDDFRSDDAPRVPMTAGGPADADDQELFAAILARASTELRFETAVDAFHALTLVMDDGNACLISYRAGEDDDAASTHNLMVVAMPQDAAIPSGGGGWRTHGNGVPGAGVPPATQGQPSHCR